LPRLQGKKNGGVATLAQIASLRQAIRQLQEQCRQRSQSVAGVLVSAEEVAESCPICGKATRVLKTWQRTGVTLNHGSFHLRQTVRVCVSGCRRKKRSGALAGIIPSRNVVGYDVMVHVGLERFLRHRQREEIRAALAADHGILLSSGEISVLAARFLKYLERLHHASAPALRAALAADGGWPLHVDATGEDGRGTLLVAFAGWRQWVLGAWKVPTERADAILPRLREVTFRFGPPRAIVRDLGRAMVEATQELVKSLHLSIPVLACHLHFLSDIGKDLLEDSHDRLRVVFRQVNVRKQLRTLARDLGRSLGQDIEEARAGLRRWQTEAGDGNRLPAGSAGIATVRALAQWILDYPADGSGDGFPFDLPWLALYDRCLQVSGALAAFIEDPSNDSVRKPLQRLRRILQPIEDDVSAVASVAETLTQRAGLFAELRTALRLKNESSRGKIRPNNPDSGIVELKDIRSALRRLTRSLRRRRPNRGPAQDRRQAIDIVLAHLETHGRFLWGHAIRLPKRVGGGVHLVDRTNNVLESYFHALKHGERRRSGRKILTQDFERLPPAAALAANLKHADYVSIVCGSLDRLPEAFARLDLRTRRVAKSPVSIMASSADVETASLSTADRKLVRTEEMTHRVIEAAQVGSRKRRVA
ncbi:MAG: hypothetical protein ACREUU_07060, partial [Gammaproteobacteria bacterium]